MNHEWYRNFFDKDFCEYAERVRPVEMQAREHSYLRSILEEAGSRTVIEVGCGTGMRTVSLALAGFEVIALDLSSWALQQANSRGAKASIRAHWQRLELLNDSMLPGVKADAAIVPGWLFGCGSDCDQLRMLRTLRCHLVPQGLLVIEAKPSWLHDAHFKTDAKGAIDGECRIESEFDVATSRLSGHLVVSKAEKQDEYLPYSMRVYTTTELVKLAMEAGFAIARLDADLTLGTGPTLNSGTTHVLARALSAPPSALAVTSWGEQPKGELDLRYADDEAELLRPSPFEVWKDLLRDPVSGANEAASYYAVTDPFGSERYVKSVEAYFGCQLDSRQLTFGAGVTSLLHDLCGLSDGGLIAAPEMVHGDLEAWAVSRGNEIRVLSGPSDVNSILETLEMFRPALLHMDRPTFDGQVIDLNGIECIAKTAKRHGTVVLIDESAATCLGPKLSSACIVHHLDNLVVVRGFTKAYSWCGLRVGFAVASSRLADRVRELVAPLQVSEISLKAISKMLAAGDIFSELRARIRATKPEVIRQLELSGLAIIAGHDNLPWVTIRDIDGDASRLLEQRRIVALRPTLPPVYPPLKVDLLRLTVPLSERRMLLFHELMATRSPVVA